MKEYPSYDNIVLFDGVCNFCNYWVQFVIKRERKPLFKYASLQSETGRLLLEKYGLHNKGIDSGVFITNGKAYLKSDVALHMSKYLKGLYPLLFVFIIVPPFIRNAVYDWIAKNRYKWYGKKDSCMIPTPEMRERFVDL